MRTTRTSGGRSSDEQDQQNFAQAVDGAACEGSDPTVHRELAVVAALRRAGTMVGPNLMERDRMRQRIMAEFASVVHEGNSPLLPLPASRQRRWMSGQTRGRVVVAAAAGLCLLMSLSATSVVLSRDAVPGDALYTFKRTTESAELGLTFGDQPKALKHLEFAGDRVNEIEFMASHSESVGDWSAGAGKFLQALDDFDSDTTAGARLLTGLAVGGHPSSLSALRAWAEHQKVRLAALRRALPLPISARLDNTLSLLDRLAARAAALSGRVPCVTITSGAGDDLGLVPAKDACKPGPVQGTSSAAVPAPDIPTPPAASPPSLVAPPNLLLPPPSVNPVPVPTQNSASPRSPLRATHNPGNVLPNPHQPEDPEPLRPRPWGPLPGHDSPRPAAPLPPLIPQPRLLPPA